MNALLTRSPAAQHDEHDESLAPVRPSRRVQAAELEITPLIDITFLLLIFFLVASRPDIQSSLALPRARHGQGVSARNATVITVALRTEHGDAAVYLAEDKTGTPLPLDPEIEAQAIQEHVEQGLARGHTNILIKAERDVRHREVARVAAAAALDGVLMYYAVLESD